MNKKKQSVSKRNKSLHSKNRKKSYRGHIIGEVKMMRSGAALVLTDDIREEVFVTGPNLNHALQGDKVKVYLYARRKGGQMLGEVTEILEHRERSFVGTIQLSAHYAFLIPDNRDMPYDIFIHPRNLNEAEEGMKAVVKIIDWPRGAKNPFGAVVDVLGKAGAHDTEMHAILAEFELPYRFQDSVLQAAEKIPEGFDNREIARRRDFRKVTTFTIDPEDAQDFDDALSVRELPNGHWEIGIHIADVSYYVKPDSVIDREAYERGTSVYLVDRVVPMLPERLSNQLCSLKPHRDRLCFSAVFEMDEKAVVHKSWFGHTVIHSDRRFNYGEVQQIIETGKGDFQDEILQSHKLASALRSIRFKAGAFSFERVEVKFNLDEEGRPTGVYFNEAKEANWLVEEFMLLANKKVAEKIGRVKKGQHAKTFVYRIHDRPDPEKLENFSNFVNQFGYSVKTTNRQAIAASMNRLMHRIKGTNEEYIIENLAVRAMAKAKYSCKNIGHYGLSFAYYTHFTSPIRRYPDLMVHRLLDRYLNGGSSYSDSACELKCVQSSMMEDRAVKAERASVKYKQVEFMQDQTGKKFEGIISGVSEWGFYVELKENLCEGLVSIRDLDDDFYEYDEKNYRLTGIHNRRVFTMGQVVTVEILRTNLAKRQLDFGLVDR
ncbi:MAG: ribonuclease R [Bacteroidales bacterium]|nr:ribonuclease R [Bacteroidales bacterium]